MTILCCTALCNPVHAQTVPADTANIVERLPDGSLIVVADGIKYRAITPEHLRSVQTTKVNLQSCAEGNQVLIEKTDKLLLALQTSKESNAVTLEQKNLEKARADEFKRMFEDERALRQQAEKLPSKKNVFEKILNHPVVQVAIVAVAGIAAVK